jgi:hypothetical protein
MDMESDMCDGDMDMPEIFRFMIITHLPLDCLQKERGPRRGSRERSRKE